MAEVPSAGSQTVVAGKRRMAASSASTIARIRLPTINTRPNRWTACSEAVRSEAKPLRTIWETSSALSASTVGAVGSDTATTLAGTW